MKNFTHKKPAVAIVAAVLCLCLAVGVGAAVDGGMFADVKNWNGAVVGTEYLNATEEISVSAEAEAGLLSVNAVFEKAGEAPYNTFEEFGKATYTITDKDGNVVKEGETKLVPVEEGSAVLGINIPELDEGEYIVNLSSFVGTSKAEQPLPIKGSWSAEFIA